MIIRHAVDAAVLCCLAECGSSRSAAEAAACETCYRPRPNYSSRTKHWTERQNVEWWQAEAQHSVIG